MDVQRGDQVYYRGEVWTVRTVRFSRWNPAILQLEQRSEDGWVRTHAVYKGSVRRVEQVR